MSLSVRADNPCGGEIRAAARGRHDLLPGCHTLDDDHIGFLFGAATPATISDASKVSFMRVTSGDLPQLMRSGC